MREAEQERVRQEEEDNWSKALSGELVGRRRAAIGAAENVSESQISENWELLNVTRDEELYTAMYKSE